MGSLVARFWSTDRDLSLLLGSLVALIFVIPPLRARADAAATLLVQIFFTLVFVSGLSATTPSRAARVVGTVILAVAIALHWLDYFNPGLGAWTAFGRLLAVSLLTVLVLRQVFREGPITRQRIQGAVVVYLLLGLTWARASTT